MSEEKVRVSGEVSRSANSPVLPTVNPDSEKRQSDAASNGIHPAFYVMSVCPILYAIRQLLIHHAGSGSPYPPVSFFSTNGFSLHLASVRGFEIVAGRGINTDQIKRLPNPSHVMAFGIRNCHDTNHGSHNETSGRTENSEDDWQSLPESYCPNWSLLLFELDLRKPDLLVLECIIYPNAEGRVPRGTQWVCMTDLYVGLHSCCCSRCRMGSPNRSCGLEETWKRLLDCRWCCFGLLRRNRLRSYRFPIPSCWYCFRSSQDLHGSKIAQWCRV